MNEEGSRLRHHVTQESSLSRGLIVHQGRANRLAAAEYNVAIKRCVKLEHMKTRSILQKQVRTSRLEEVEVAQCSQFVRSLKFSEMNARRTNIVDPHCRTFEWIFHDTIGRPWDSFKEFLENPASIYWINGKAGSGKSSLMRFVCEHEKCQQMLDLWSSPKKTLILSWYFWNSGTQSQKSLRGALSALSHQILSQDQSLASSVFRSHTLNPTKFAKESATDWSVTELVQLFVAALKSAQSHVIIFLDGLDEFNHDEDISRLLILIEEVTIQSHVKACVSSRPERYLESRLEFYPQLNLQDLTANDISTFVMDRLRSSTPDWEDSEIRQLSERVRERASGVFLWVRLVTDQLVRGLLHGDTQQILTERLEKLPPKMESLYEHMWRSLNGDEDLQSYRQQAGKCLAFHQIFPMTVFELTVALDDDLQHKFIEGVHKTAEVKFLLEKCAAIQDLLKTRCAGLLEISSTLVLEAVKPGNVLSCSKHQALDCSSFSSDRHSHGLVQAAKSSSRGNVVQLAEEFPDNDALLQYLTRIGTLEINFIHRSAKDFLLETTKGQQIRQHCTWTTMDVTARVVHAYLQRKILGLSALFNANGRSNSKYIDLNRLVSLILNDEDLQPTTPQQQYSLLKTIDSVYQTMIDSERTASQSEWQENWYFYSSEQSGYLIDFWGSIATHLSSKLCKLVLSHCPSDAMVSTYFLASVCWMPDFDVISSRNLHAIHTFLDHGADPNSTCMYTHQDHAQVTPWLRFLRLASRTVDYSGIEAQLVSTIENFRASGAELSAIATTVWQYTRGELDCFDALMTLNFHEPGEAVFEVNAAYFLEKIWSRIRDPGLASKLQHMLEPIAPTQRVTLVRGSNGRWFTVEPDAAVEFLEKVLNPVEVELDYAEIAEYARKVTISGVVVKPRNFLAARSSVNVCPRPQSFGGLEHLRRASSMLQARDTVSWLASTWSTIGITSVLANGFSEIPNSEGHLTRFTLLEDICNNLASFHELYGPLYLYATETDEVYSIISEVWEELAVFGKEEATKLAGQELEIFNDELDELGQLFHKHGLDHAHSLGI